MGRSQQGTKRELLVEVDRPGGAFRGRNLDSKNREAKNGERDRERERELELENFILQGLYHRFSQKPNN